jgi:hypothetical protein
VVEQLALEGGIDVVELHGVGGRTCSNVLRNLTPAAAGRMVRDAQHFYGAELVAGTEGDLARPCPHCGAKGDAEEIFGFRFMGGKRVRQSWCRACRTGGRRERAA